MFDYELHKALKEAGSSQKELAKQTGIPEARISYIINGNWNMSDEEKEKIETALKKKVWG